MKYLLSILLIAGFITPQQEDFSKTFQTRQLIVVTSDNWNTTHGRLSFYELNAENKWKPILKDIAVMLGRTGMAWGAGLQPADLNTGKLKHEGDGKSPAGIFKLNRLFSYGEMEARMDHIEADSTLFCVDDVNSAYYNQLVNTRDTEKDWNSAEEMRRTDHQYKFGVVVAYNTEGIKKGAGSCIFLHIWKSPENTTSGCTSMTESNLLTIMQALDKNKNPVLVQMPTKEYSQLKKAYALP